MSGRLKISEALSSSELRMWARHRDGGLAAAWGYAIANALDGADRFEAARLAEMARRAPRGFVAPLTRSIRFERDTPKASAIRLIGNRPSPATAAARSVFP